MDAWIQITTAAGETYGHSLYVYVYNSSTGLLRLGSYGDVDNPIKGSYTISVFANCVDGKMTPDSIYQEFYFEKIE
jgi:hypothetical protein